MYAKCHDDLHIGKGKQVVGLGKRDGFLDHQQQHHENQHEKGPCEDL